MVTLKRQLDLKKGGYFKTARKDGLATQFLSCSLWHAPPTCFLCSLCNFATIYTNILYLFQANTSHIPPLNRGEDSSPESRFAISYPKGFHYTNHANLALQYPFLLKGMFLGCFKKKHLLIKLQIFQFSFAFNVLTPGTSRVILFLAFCHF